VTPFARGVLAAARERGARTALLTCAPPDGLEGLADLLVALATGPEILTGSTRLKAGSATKAALNAITTAAMIRLGKVYENLMVDLRPGSAKLRDRARRILRAATGLDEEAARTRLDEAAGELKTAIVMSRRGVDAEQARELLRTPPAATSAPRWKRSPEGALSGARPLRASSKRPTSRSAGNLRRSALTDLRQRRRTRGRPPPAPPARTIPPRMHRTATPAALLPRLLLLRLLFLFGATLLATGARAGDDLRNRVEALIAGSGAEVAVAYRSLDAGATPVDELLIAPDEVFHAASTMKIPVMIELFRQAAPASSRSTTRSRSTTSSPRSSTAPPTR
jgi:hypothetical protein